MEIRPVGAPTPPPARPAPPDMGPRDTFVPNTDPPSPLRMPATSESRRAAEALLVPSAARAEARETLLRDLSTFPAPVLRLLKQDGVRVVLLARGQSLADTPLLPKIEPEAYRGHLEAARQIFDGIVATETRATKDSLPPGADDLQRGMAPYWEGKRIAEAAAAQLSRAGIGVKHTTEPIDLDVLADQQRVPPANREEWLASLQRLNGAHLEIHNGLARPRHQVLLVPFTYHRGRPVAPAVLASLQRVDEAKVKGALGLHLPDERLVVLHEDYVTDPAPQLGHYRIALHETGHAVDHAADRKLGPEHRETVDRLYAADRATLAGGGPNRFLSPRAMDDAREYFAEAMEAFLTDPLPGDAYKAGNHHERLQALNPALHAWVGELLGHRLAP